MCVFVTMEQCFKAANPTQRQKQAHLGPQASIFVSSILSTSSMHLHKLQLTELAPRYHSVNQLTWLGMRVRV